MAKILYLMGINWYWIRQRPQIVAEMLSKDYDITVAYYKEIFVKQSLRKDNDELENSIPVPAIPYRDKNLLAYHTQKMFFYKTMRSIQEYDIVWISHPLLYRYVPRSYRGKIVYDCMDNHEALCADNKVQKKIHNVESALTQRADMILASSSGLAEKMRIIGGGEKVLLVRNGFPLKEMHPPQPVSRKETKSYKIGYFGTIAEWFDFPLLLNSLDKFPELEYHLWGPVSGIQLPRHTRLKYGGVVEHRQLWENVKDMDCLIMPFKVNDLIRDVDPVKLYEYISMGKSIISVSYEEITRFHPYVYFYNTEKEYQNIVSGLIRKKIDCLYDTVEQKRFLSCNSWEERYQEIKAGLVNI